MRASAVLTARQSSQLGSPQGCRVYSQYCTAPCEQPVGNVPEVGFLVRVGDLVAEVYGATERFVKRLVFVFGDGSHGARVSCERSTNYNRSTRGGSAARTLNCRENNAFPALRYRPWPVHRPLRERRRRGSGAPPRGALRPPREHRQAGRARTPPRTASCTSARRISSMAACSIARSSGSSRFASPSLSCNSRSIRCRSLIRPPSRIVYPRV